LCNTHAQFVLALVSNRTWQVDVYAFGIFMWELAMHCLELPFAKYSREELQRGQHLMDGNVTIISAGNGLTEEWVIPASNRPTIPASCDDEYAQLMQQCWATHPKQRPAFPEIVSRLEAICARLQSHAAPGRDGRSDQGLRQGSDHLGKKQGLRNKGRGRACHAVPAVPRRG
jgi:hypothetical protein